MGWIEGSGGGLEEVREGTKQNSELLSHADNCLVPIVALAVICGLGISH